MKTMHVIARIPLGYNDFGEYALNEVGREKFDELICSRLPEDAYWCGDEILAPVDSDIDINISDIISAAGVEMMGLGEEYWEDYS